MESDEEAGCCGQQKEDAPRSQAKVKIPASFVNKTPTLRA